MAGEPNTNLGDEAIPALVPLGERGGRTALPLGRPFILIGSRNRAHLHLASESVSRNHACVIQDNGLQYVRDLGSRTGVALNGRPVRESKLRDGDRLEIGPFRFRYVNPARGSGAETEVAAARAVLSVEGIATPLDGHTLLIGRSSRVDIPLDSNLVSSTHTLVYQVGSRHCVRDLGSRTGTFVNGTAVHEQALEFGDEIRIGETVFRYLRDPSNDAALPLEDVQTAEAAAGKVFDHVVAGDDAVNATDPPGESVDNLDEPEGPIGLKFDWENVATSEGHEDRATAVDNGVVAVGSNVIERDRPSEDPGPGGYAPADIATEALRVCDEPEDTSGPVPWLGVDGQPIVISLRVPGPEMWLSAAVDVIGESLAGFDSPQLGPTPDPVLAEENERADVVSGEVHTAAFNPFHFGDEEDFPVQDLEKADSLETGEQISSGIAAAEEDIESYLASLVKEHGFDDRLAEFKSWDEKPSESTSEVEALSGSAGASAAELEPAPAPLPPLRDVRTPRRLVPIAPQVSASRHRFSPLGSITGSVRYGRQTVRTAVRALRRNKMRSALTCLGIVIGIASVTALMEIGHGASVAMQTAIEQFGANLVWVFPTDASAGNGVSLGTGTRVTLTPEDCDAINEQCTAVKMAVPNVAARLQLVRANRNWQPNSIYGTTPEYLEIGNWQVTEGGPFTDLDVLRGAQVCLIGQTLARELFEGESPVGQTIRVRNTNLAVVGVLNEKGAALTGWDQDDIIVVPWTTVKYRLSGSTLSKVNQSAADASASVYKVNTLSNAYPRVSSSPLPAPSAIQVANTPQMVRFENVDQILVAARSRDQIPTAIQQITDLLRERHRIPEGQANDFGVFDVTEFSNTVTATAGFMHNLLLSVAAISLMVGGIGIMNIMLVSTTERTREIGLRMAVGARAKDILRQFLIEAVSLCVLGGIIGVLVGRCVSLVAERFLNWPVAISVPAIIAALTVAGFVGIIFGFYPAWKASRLDPIDALRYE